MPSIFQGPPLQVGVHHNLLEQLLRLGDVHRLVELGDGLLVLHHGPKLLQAPRILNYFENRGEGFFEAASPAPDGGVGQPVDMRLGTGLCVGSGLQHNRWCGRFLFEGEDARPRCSPGGGDLLVGLRLRDAELLVDVAGGYPQPDLPNEHVQDVGGLLQVFPFLAVKLYLGDALVLAEVENAERANEVAPEGGGQGLAVGHGQIVPDVVVSLALGVAAAARV